MSEFDGVTLFVDASFTPRYRAGFGAWYRHSSMSRGELIGGKVLARCNTSHEAELHAIMHAVEHLKSSSLLPTKRVLIIQSDCLRALELIASLSVDVQVASRAHHQDSHIGSMKQTSISPIEKNALERLEELLRDETVVYVRHIKGHRSNGNRSWVNNQCDMIANRHRKEAMKQGI